MGSLQQALLCSGASVASATFDPAAKSAVIALSNGNLTMTSTSTQGSAKTTTSKASGSYYFEMLVGGTLGVGYTHTVGVITAAAGAPTQLGDSVNSWSWIFGSTNSQYYHSGGTSGSPPTCSNGDVIMCAIDLTAGKLWFGRNGTWNNSSDPAAGTSPAFTSVTGTLMPGGSVTASTRELTYRPNSASQTYSPPSGFSAWS